MKLATNQSVFHIFCSFNRYSFTHVPASHHPVAHILIIPFFNEYAFNETSIRFSSGRTRRLELNFTVALAPIYSMWGESDMNTCKHCSGKNAYCTVRIKAGFQISMWLEKTHLFLVQLLNLSLAPRCEEHNYTLKLHHLVLADSARVEH